MALDGGSPGGQLPGGRRRARTGFRDSPSKKAAVRPSTIRVNVATRKFTGTVEIFFIRSRDLYGIRLHQQGGPDTDVLLEDIGFEELGEAIQDAIDDGSWQFARVTVLRRAKAARFGSCLRSAAWQRLEFCDTRPAREELGATGGDVPALHLQPQRPRLARGPLAACNRPFRTTGRPAWPRLPNPGERHASAGRKRRRRRDPGTVTRPASPNPPQIRPWGGFCFFLVGRPTAHQTAVRRRWSCAWLEKMGAILQIARSPSSCPRLNSARGVRGTGSNRPNPGATARGHERRRLERGCRHRSDGADAPDGTRRRGNRGIHSRPCESSPPMQRPQRSRPSGCPNRIWQVSRSTLMPVTGAYMCCTWSATLAWCFSAVSCRMRSVRAGCPRCCPPHALQDREPGGGEMAHPHRTSSGMFFKRGETDLIRTIRGASQRW